MRSADVRPHRRGRGAAVSAVGAPREPYEDCVDGVVARMVAELGPGTDPGEVESVVLGCCRDLRGVPLGAMPELVERLARLRLAGAEHGRGRHPG